MCLFVSLKLAQNSFWLGGPTLVRGDCVPCETVSVQSVMVGTVPSGSVALLALRHQRAHAHQSSILADHCEYMLPYTSLLFKPSQYLTSLTPFEFCNVT